MKKLVFILALVILLCSCSTSQGDGYISTVADLSGLKAGVMTGTPQDEMVLKLVPDAQLLQFNSLTDIALALDLGKVDFFILSKEAFALSKVEFPHMSMMKNLVVQTFDVGTIFPKTPNGEALKKQMDEYIKAKKADGTIAMWEEYWLYPDNPTPPEIPTTGENGTIYAAICTTNKPYAFMVDGKFGGFDVAILAGFAQEYGYGLKIDDCNMAGMLDGINLGRYDLAASQISWTEARAEKVLYSELYHTQELGFVVRTDDLAYKDEDVTVDEETFWESIKDSFHKTFVEQKRWQLILSGLLSTLIITVFGFILANVLGAAACAMAMAKSKILKAIASAYSSIMQGTPMVVVLLILYYVIFGHSSLSGTIVAIIGFGLVTGAYMAQLFQGALQGVDKGQIEASLALGFSKAKTFRYIIFPQALRSAITGYFSQIISLLKSTAIVGYIAVNDLTKVGDIIRSSTYESLFPLLSIAIIYFLVAALLLFILRRCLSALAYKRGYKKIKGVSL